MNSSLMSPKCQVPCQGPRREVLPPVRAQVSRAGAAAALASSLRSLTHSDIVTSSVLLMCFQSPEGDRRLKEKDL